MVPEFGHYALILALLLALMQGVLPFVGAQKGQLALMKLARSTAVGQFVFVLFSFGCLAYAFLSNDFSVAYVAQNANTHLPWIYRLCAVWGAHEGSLLLWILVLSGWMAAVALFSRSLPLEMVARVLGVMAWIAIGFYLFTLLTSDPFARLLPNFPINGADLDPLLQDPGMVGHPPMLYMGYVGFSVAFAFAIAALLGGRLDDAWAKWTRPWTTVAWCFLTLGITLGSWWSYRELGWGGWWFWDPVENASFMPWLVGTALMHSLAVVEKRGVFKAWTVLLAVAAFSLSLFGTFLVRSGVLISVHSFAEDPARGRYLLEFLIVVVGASLLIYAIRGRKLVAPIGQFRLWSRETGLLLNNVFLFVGMLTVLLGTLYPLIIAEMGLPKISVGYPYFNAVFLPIMVPMIFVMAVGPLLRWKAIEPALLHKRLGMLLVLSVLLALLLPWAVGASFHWKVVLGLLCALWLGITMLLMMWQKVHRNSVLLKRLPVGEWSMLLAHLGVAITICGLVLTSAYSQQALIKLPLGGSTPLAGYVFHFDHLQQFEGPNYKALQASVSVTQGKQLISVLHPQLRLYPVQKDEISKTAVTVGVFRDLYVALGAPVGKYDWTMRIYYKPFVRWIWYGGLLMALGGFLAVLNRRYRRKRHA